MKITTTPKILDLIPKELQGKIDPNGRHILRTPLLHNDVEVRCIIWLKMVDTIEPTIIQLDIPLDRFNKIADLPELDTTPTPKAP